VRVVGCVLLVSLLVGCGGEEGDSRANEIAPTVSFAPTVTVETLTAQPYHSVIQTFGVVEALEEVDVASEISGTVKLLLVSEGDAVEMGDVLLELDSEKQRYRVTQARQQAEQGKALLDEAQLRLNRRLELAEKDTISKEDLDNARLQVLAIGAAYQRALAAQHLAERELQDTQVRSPSAGLVDQKFIEPGEAVSIGTTLVSLQVVHTMRVHTWVSEADIILVRANNKASVTLSGAPLNEYDAVVEWVGVNADPSTGNFPVKLLLQEASDLIRPGMTATATIKSITMPNLLIVPEQALLDRDRRRVVMVAETRDGKTIARQREPQLAAGFSNRLVVLSGLSEGERVIVSGQAQLVDGSEVKVQVQEAP
jgi:RND family efflux transporter MFP subunit